LVSFEERHVAEDVLQITDGEFVFRLSDPKIGSLNGPVLEIGPLGVLISTRQQFDSAVYETVLDVTIELKGHLSRQFFASVAGNESNGVRLSWLNIDPGQQGRLKVLLDAYRARYANKIGATPTDPAAGHKTRRMIKPSPPATTIPKPASAVDKSIINLFGSDPTPNANKVLEQPVSERHDTRRTIKPSAQSPLSLFGESEDTAKPAPARDPLDDSKAHQVVIASTARYDNLAKPTLPSEPTPNPQEEAEVAAAADAGKVVVGQDGRMDIGATLRSKAKTVRASELAARHDKVRVLNLATIKALIMEAVEEAANHLSRALSEADRKRLLEEAEEGFKERMKAFHEEKATADEKSKKLADQLHMAQKLLEDERKRSITSDQFTVSSAGLGELEGGFQKLIDRAIAEGKLDDGLENQLRNLATKVFDEERQRIREKEMQAQNDKIELLEKKIKRLAGNLEETERQRDEAREIAQALEGMGGQGMSMEQIKNKFKIGLNKDDPRREAKLAIMKELLEENRDLRRKLGIALNEVKPEAPKPEPVAAEPVAEAPSEVAVGEIEMGATDTSDLINPDDEPWSADDAPVISTELKRFGSTDAADSEEVTGEEINPDDAPWEPPAPPATPPADTEEGGVKILRTFKNFEPPPLIKR
jgi:hypothetical protein